jgi:hypothetical protein
LNDKEDNDSLRKIQCRIAETRDSREKEQFLAQSLIAIGANDATWSAADSAGCLREPPVSHILAAAVAYFGILDDSTTYPWVRGPLTVALVPKLPMCDICNGELARYDAQVTAASGMWGFMCSFCYRRNSSLTLGAGMGQYLLLDEKLPTWVQELLGQFTHQL